MKPKFTDASKYRNGYRRACDTDIRKTFDRIRREQQANAKEAAVKVEQLPRRKTA